MIHFILSALWESFYTQVGLAGLILLGAVAVFLYVPLPNVRHLAVGVATGCIVFLFTATHFYIEGIRHEKARWDAAEQAAIERGAQARTDAEREVAADPPPSDPDAPAGVLGRWRPLARFIPAGRVRHDIYDRDNR